MKINLQTALAEAVAPAAPAPKAKASKPAKATGKPTKPQTSREGKEALTTWLSPSFKRSLLLVKAQTGETQEQIVARALNDVFKAAGVPVVSE